MAAIRWFAVVLFVALLGLGCGERKPDTDPTDAELQVPEVDGGDSGTHTLFAPRSFV